MVKKHLNMHLLRQITAFGLVGVFATLLHVAVAWMLIECAALNGLLANACGAAAAFSVSYLGNARITFVSRRGLWNGAARYLPVTLVSLVLSSVILTLTHANGLPTFVYVGIVLFTVPPTTFLLAKFWTFHPLPEGND